jgi:drug/metabolite transporter (DMT)-like permease
MNKKALRADLLLLLTSCIWGFGFVAQRTGMDYVGPFTFNGIRFPLGSLSLLPLILFRGKRGLDQNQPRAGRGKTFLATLAVGSCLFIAVTLQQLGILFTTVGNAGFITGLYVVLTPIFGIFLGKKTGVPTWIGAALIITGLYFLSAVGHLSAINPGDLLVIISALFWACHVLLIDHLVQHIDPLQLSSGQFAWCGFFSIIAIFVLEPSVGSWAEFVAPGTALQEWGSLPGIIASFRIGPVAASGVIAGLIPILYSGFGAVGTAYTLQVVAQKDAPPAHATIILSLEGVFAALGGILFLGEQPGPFTLLGFALMFSGMLVTQWEVIAGGGRRGRAA